MADCQILTDPPSPTAREKQEPPDLRAARGGPPPGSGAHVFENDSAASRRTSWLWRC